MKNGVQRIAAERKRQTEKEGWDQKHDAEHDDGSLAMAAACYAASNPIFVHEKRAVQVNSSRGIDENCYSYPTRLRMGYWDPWPWDDAYDKREKHNRIRQLEIAGALIAAEIDRLLLKQSEPGDES